LRIPADNSNDVTENTRFIVEAPGWSDAVQIEICIDISCLKPRLIVSDAPVVERQASFALGKLPEERLLYWRAKGRKQGKVIEPPSETHSFRRKAMAPPTAGIGTAAKTDRPKVGRPELAIMDAAVATGDFERLVDLAQLSTQATQHIEIALRLANAEQCSDLLRVLALPVEPGHGLDSEIRQLGADCTVKLDEAYHRNTSWTTKRKVAAAMAGVSAAGMIAGTVLGVQAKSKYNSAHEICSDTRVPCMNADRVNELIKEARGRAFSADIVFGVAGATAIGAGVLWFIGAPQTHTRRLDIAPTIAPGRSGIAVYGTF
jgi:hypothetical protein